MALLDSAGFFRNTLLATVGASNLPASAKRVPFTFTSTARLLKAGKVEALGSNYTKNQSAIDTKRVLARIEEETRGLAAARQLGLSGLIDGFQNAQQSIVGLNMPVVSMAVNPQSIQWNQNKRFTKRDTMDGSTFFHFTNSVDQNNDILTCSFSGKTGNINTQADFGSILQTGANLKLRVWHELYNLSREPMLLNKLNTGKDVPHGMKNEFFISYRTVLMPVQITLIGFFNTVLNFTETAADPFNRDYNFAFTVTKTSPSLDELSTMMNSSLSTIGQVKSIASDVTALASGSVDPNGIKVGNT